MEIVKRQDTRFDWKSRPDELINVSIGFLDKYGEEMQDIFSSYATRAQVDFNSYSEDLKVIPGSRDRTLSLLALYRFLARKLEEVFPEELKSDMDSLRVESRNSDRRELWQEKNFLWRQNKIFKSFVEGRKYLMCGFELLEAEEVVVEYE